MTDLPPIIIDTREKKPYSFYGHDVIRRKMDTGDYSLEGYVNSFAVERKSLPDYLQSISWERDRFEDEVERGSNMKRFVVVIEASEEEVRKGNYRKDVPPLAAINTAKGWSRKDRYGVPFHWTGGRREAKAKTLNLLQDWYQDFK